MGRDRLDGDKCAPRGIRSLYSLRLPICTFAFQLGSRVQVGATLKR